MRKQTSIGLAIALAAVLLITTAAWVSSSPTVTAAPTDYSPPFKAERIGRLGGVVNDVVTKDSFAYVAVDNQLLVFNLSNPAAPQLLEVLELGTRPLLSLAIRGNTLYAGHWAKMIQDPSLGTVFKGGLFAIDLTDPAHPVLVNDADVQVVAESIAIAGSYAYITNASSLMIFDLTEPFTPTLVGTWPGYQIHGVAVSNAIAYVAADSELTLLNVADPSNPTPLSTYSPFSFSNVKVVGVQGTNVYIAGGVYDAVVEVVNVATPTAPTYAGNYALTYSGQDLGKSQVKDFLFTGNYLYIAVRDQGLYVANRGNFDTPTRRAVPGGINALGLSSSFVYGGGDNGEMTVWNVSTPATPTPAGAYHMPGYAGYQSLSKSGNHLYLSGATLHILNVSNLSQPAEEAQENTSGRGIIFNGDYAYRISNQNVQILNVADPIAPTIVKQIPLSGYPQALAHHGNFLYIAEAASPDKGRLRIVDVSNPATPQVRGVYTTTSGYPIALAATDNVVYLCQPGFKVINVADPDHPVEIPNTFGITAPQRVQIVGNRAYIATGSWGNYTGLWILDITAPQAPTVLGSYVKNNAWYQTGALAVAGNYAFIADPSTGLRIMDVSDPAHPRPVMDNPTFRAIKPLDVLAEGSFVYVGGGDQGLLIFEVAPDPNILYGWLLDQNGVPLYESVNIAVQSATYSEIVTAQNYYVLENLPAGTFTLRPTNPGYIWKPATHTATLPRQQAYSQDFVAYNLYKEVSPEDIAQYGDVLTYTLSLIFPNAGGPRSVYDLIPTHTTYISHSLLAPHGITYDPALNAIVGSIPITPTQIHQITYRVQVNITGTQEFHPPIINQACLHPYDSAPPLTCAFYSNEVKTPTYNFIKIYLPLVLRGN